MPNYVYGFGNTFSTEAVKGALPLKQNSPQQVPFGLYPEQLSGSAFTQTRPQNLRSWLYRLQPSIALCPDEFKIYSGNNLFMQGLCESFPPTQLRWDPLPTPEKDLDFIDSLITWATSGNALQRQGGAIHLYAMTASMENRYCYNADGEWLFVLQHGNLIFKTEFGVIEAEPGEIVVIPRGVRFQILLTEKKAHGYICENYSAPFRLAELGTIGANALANPRHFAYPMAAFEDRKGSFQFIAKFANHLWQTELTYSPLDVVAWYGNYAPYKYDLNLFNTIGTISFDHPDPSIYTVLTSPSVIPQLANIDFVIFPKHWEVADHTFRLPYYHRNIMSEFMGLIHGNYAAKKDGFVAGGMSLHNCMSPHGPDQAGYKQATLETLKPHFQEGMLAFMFESATLWQPTQFALNTALRQKNYLSCWEGLPRAKCPK